MPPQEVPSCRRCGSTMQLHSVQNVLGKDKRGHAVRVYECSCGRLHAEDLADSAVGEKPEAA